MAQVKSVADWMTERSVSVERLAELSGLEKKVVEAVTRGRYTPSPEQRQRLAAALGVGPQQVAWGYAVPVTHVYGHGPQFGRSP